jgi:hypothetical protein
MLALYRSGRQAKALGAYQSTRSTLVDELGIEPSLALQELERAIPCQDPALELAQATVLERSILVASLGDAPPEPLLLLGVAAEPLLIEPGPDALVTVATEVAVTVVGPSDRWHKEGLRSTRAALAAAGSPTLLVRKGLRPGGLAPAENLTRFTWLLRG